MPSPSFSSTALRLHLQSHSRLYTFLIACLILVGLFTRLALILLSGRAAEGILSGGSDAPAYILLGSTLAKGHGMTYVGQPTALRAPLYPLLLAALDLLFGSYSLLIMRLVQFAAAILTAWVCAKTAALLWGQGAKWPAFALALFMPTLLFFTSQILTETFTALLVSVFLYFLVLYCQQDQAKSLVSMGVCAGILLLLRFNVLFIPLVAAAAAIRSSLTSAAMKRALTPAILAALLASPWLIRNLSVFHGQLLYSSQTGTTAFQGALAPQGRTQPDGLLALQKRQGWWLSDIETDRPVRLQYPSEVELNRQAKYEALRAWKELGFRIFPLLAKKISYFWLSTDQLFSTGSFSAKQRILRAAGVLLYWPFLAAAILGWLRLRKIAPRITCLFLLYCALATILHLPFTMNTRLRVPLVDPILCILAAGPFSFYRHPFQ